MNTDRSSVARWWWGCVACLLLTWTLPVHARTVAVLQPEHAAAEVVETLSRIHGELLAVGLSVQVVQRALHASDSAEPGAWLPAHNAQASFDAAIVVVEETSPPTVEVWLFADASRASRVARVRVEPGTRNAPEKLAIRAIEVLRSAFLESDMANQRRGPEPARRAPSAVPADATQTPAAPSRLGLSAGIATLTSLGGVGPMVMPMARLDVALGSAVTLHAAIAGLGSRSLVESGAYSAEVRRNHALLGGRYFVSTSSNLRPFAALALGVATTSIAGRATSPALGHEQTVRSLLIDAGLGVDWRWFERYYVSLATHVYIANPSATVHLADSPVATTGRPDLALTLTVGAWL
jgi:hypothetical protein